MADISKETYRSIVPIIREQLPSYILDTESILPDFLEAYYEWLEQEGNPTEVINRAADTYDIDKTLDRFYSEFKYEYLNKFPRDINTNKETLVKNIREFYRAKGTEKAVKLLFRILFNEEVVLQYPSEQVLKPSSGTWIKKTIIRVTNTNDTIFGAAGREVYFLEQKVVLSGVSGNFQVGETVDSKDSTGIVYETGEVHSVTNNEIIITTDFNGQFQKNLTLEGRTSSATGTIIESEDFSKRAFIEKVNKLGTFGSVFYECEVSGLFDVVKPGLIIRTIYNDDDHPVLSFRNSPMVSSYEITNSGSEYEINTSVPLSSDGDGKDFSAIISKVKNLTKPIPGSFTPVSTLPQDVLTYVPEDGETIQSLLAPGDRIRIGTNRYLVNSVDIANQRITTATDIPSGADLTSVLKSYQKDTRGITGITITNPGYGYDTLPVINLTGLGDGTATVTLLIGGSFTEDFGYVDDKGQPSSSMRIQNDGQFQEFSYVVRSGNSINLWRDILKDHAHPAGMLVSGEIFSISASEDDINLALYHEKRNEDGVNYNNPANVSSRNFYESIIYIGGRYSISGIELVTTGDSITDTFFEFILPFSVGSQYTEMFNVGVIKNNLYDSINILDTYTIGGTIQSFSEKYLRGTSILNIT